MDRSKLQKKVATVLLSVPLLCLICNLSPCFAQEPASKKSSKEKRAEKKQPKTEVIVYYGRLAAKDKKNKFIYVEPVDHRLSRMVFYIDSKTGYVKDGFAAELDELLLGEKIAVRYLLHGDLKIAEEVFVVDGEFQPDRYRKRDVKRRVRPEKKVEK